MNKLVKKARQFAYTAHHNQLSDEGLPYFYHLDQVYDILNQVTDNPDILAAGYLHDTIEDTEVTYEILKQKFGIKIADLVNEVTHEGIKDTIGRWFPRLKSRDAILIKFSDRLSNLSRMEVWDEERRQQYIKKSTFWKSKP